MIPNVRDRTVESQGVTMTGEFGISLSDSAHIMTILRDTLYSDKILAVLREYGANAWDSHRMAGKPDLPIKIVLPTMVDPSLTIQDFGVGLSKNDVFKVFTQYGASTKRDSDTAVGMLGIGSKSGFAYSDSFTVVSCHGGSRCTYVAVLDKTEKGVINLLNEEPCGEETGVSIQMAVRPNDIHEFTSKAKELYKYFKPAPDINVELPKLPASQIALSKGAIFSTNEYRDDDQRWKAIMGCIPYRINLDQLVNFKGESTLPKVARRISGALFFNIGDVQISASREELKYSDSTKAIIAKRLEELIEEYVKQTIDGLVSQKLTPWEQRIRLHILTELDLDIPKEWEELSEQRIEIPEKLMPETFTICHGNSRNIGRIVCTEHTRLVLKNDPRALEAFQLKNHDYLIRKVDQADWEDIQKELDKLCSKLGIEGIPIKNIAEIGNDPYYVPKVTPDRLKGKRFRFEPDQKHPFGSPFSPHWKPDRKEPTASDVYVIMRKFNPTQINFFNAWGRDSKLSEAMGLTMPDIIGYRTTKKEPIDEGFVPGTTYKAWSEARRIELVKRPDYLEYLKMGEESARVGGHSINGLIDDWKKALALVKKLGDSHTISVLIQRKYALNQYFRGIDENLKECFDILGPPNTYNISRTPEIAIIQKTYRLLDVTDPLQRILHTAKGVTSHWIKYINAIDNSPPTKGKANDDSSEVHDDE